MPQIMEMEGLYQLPKAVKNSSVESRFDYIFKNRVWGTESFSGSGSTMLNTSIYRAQLKQFLNLNGNRKLKFFDAPCGDECSALVTAFGQRLDALEQAEAAQAARTRLVLVLSAAVLAVLYTIGLVATLISAKREQQESHEL